MNRRSPKSSSTAQTAAIGEALRILDLDCLLHGPDAKLSCAKTGLAMVPLWMRAARIGAPALELLASRGCNFRPHLGHFLASHCADSGLGESFAWAIGRERVSARKAWAMAAKLAERSLESQAKSMGSLRDAEEQADIAARAAAAIGPVRLAFLAELSSMSRFAPLRAALRASKIDAKASQAVCDARAQPEEGIARALSRHGPDTPLARWRAQQAAGAGAALARHAPRIDLARDARSLSPELCAFSLGAGAKPDQASSPPLAALCSAAAQAMSPEGIGWPMLSELAARGARGSEPPEALCAALLYEAGCSALASSPGHPSAQDLCRQAMARQRAASKSKAQLSRRAKIASMARWVALQIEGLPLNASPCDSPFTPLACVIDSAAERESLAKACPAKPPKAARARL